VVAPPEAGIALDVLDEHGRAVLGDESRDVFAEGQAGLVDHLLGQTARMPDPELAVGPQQQDGGHLGLQVDEDAFEEPLDHLADGERRRQIVDRVEEDRELLTAVFDHRNLARARGDRVRARRDRIGRGADFAHGLPPGIPGKSSTPWLTLRGGRTGPPGPI
jgi:hypothetical protein